MFEITVSSFINTTNSKNIKHLALAVPLVIFYRDLRTFNCSIPQTCCGPLDFLELPDAQKNRLTEFLTQIH